MSSVEKLQAKVARLPEPVAAEVLDFLEFIIAKRRHPISQPHEAIQRLRGTFRGRLSTSAAFASLKAHEIRLEE